MEHLLNIYPVVKNIWEKVHRMFYSDRSPNSLWEMVEEWKGLIFKNPVINYSCIRVLGFCLWNIWKEHNRVIFKNQRSSMEPVWKTTIGNVQEMNLVERWTKDD